MVKLKSKLEIAFSIPEDTPGFIMDPAGAGNAFSRGQTSEYYIKDFRIGHAAEWAVYHWLHASGRDTSVSPPSTLRKQNRHDPDLMGSARYHVKHISRRGVPSFTFQGSAIRMHPTYEDGVFQPFPEIDTPDDFFVGVDLRTSLPISRLQEGAEVWARIRFICELGKLYPFLEEPDQPYLRFPEKGPVHCKWVVHTKKIPKNFKDPGATPMQPLYIKPSGYTGSFDPIAFDTETELFGPGKLAPPMICLTTCDDFIGGDLYTHLDAEPFIQEMLDSGRTLVGLNVAYDMAVICQEYPDLIPDVFKAYREGRVRDVMLDQKLIDIAHGTAGKYRTMKGGYSMVGLLKRLLGIEINKDDTPRLEYGTLRDCPVEQYSPEAVEYAIKDAEYTLSLHRHQEDVINAAWMKEHGESLFLDSGRQAFHAFSLHLASVWGVRTDAQRCYILERHLDDEIDRARGLLEAHGLVRPNGTRDMKAARARMEAVCAAKGIEPERTDKGSIKLDQEVTQNSGDEVLQAYSTFVGANTLRARVQDLAWGTREALHPSYTTLMDTGRTSCRKPGGNVHGIQAQNMPRLEGSRECLEPRKGYIYVSADYNSAEMYGLAQSCKDLVGESKLGELLNAGQDPHVYLGAALYGMTYDEVMASPDKKKIRQAAKPLSFGAPGGLGAATFVKYAAQYGVNLTVDQAREHLALYREVYPEVDDYLRYCSDHLECYGEVYYAWSGRWRGGLIYTNMANGFFQARIADAALHSLDMVQEECYAVPESPLYGSRVWGFIHDEILMECPIDRAHDAALRLQALMEQGFKVYHPDYPTSAEPAIHWRWSKGVEPRYENGVLVVSDPENAPEWYKEEYGD